jgi:lysyl-tRNA synthetase, class II
MARTLRAVAAAPAALAILVGTSGWLYLIRPHVAMGGPAVPDALPLDELARRASMPLAAFVGVWGLAAVLLALLARFARAERLTAGLLLALAVGGWTFFYTGASILVVQQIPADQAFDAASHRAAVYLPALLAGAAGALLARPKACERPRSPTVLAWAVAAAGALGVADAMLPHHRHALIASLAPERVHGLSGALVAPIGFALLVAARGLARRKRAAWHVVFLLASLLVALHVAHGFDVGAIFTALVALALVARRSDFDVPPDPTRRPRLRLHGAVFTAAVGTYGLAALWVNRLMADQSYTLRFALRETARAAVGLDVAGSQHLTGTFGAWFPRSVLLLTLTAGAILLAEALAPWRYRLRQEARERQLARGLVAAWGADTLAPFVLRGDKSYFFSDDERAVLAYRVVGGVAIVSGDPIGSPDDCTDLVGCFIVFARQRGWRVAILGASERCLPLYRAHGLRAVYHGDEAVVDTASFSLDGRAIRKVRQSVHRLRKAGYTTEVLRCDAVPADLRRELEGIARAWRGDLPERGFTMALDGLFGAAGDDSLFVVGLDGGGRPAGFLHFAVSAPGAALSLSSMPRLRSTPNGFNEWLVCETVDWARRHGFERVSLNFAPFAALLAPEARLTPSQRLQRAALRRLKGHFQLDNLLLFNRKFFPAWQRRFLVYERRLDLPRVGVAALGAEAYLPFARERT